MSDKELNLYEVKKKFDDVQNQLPYLGDLWKANREIFMLLIKEVERLRGLKKTMIDMMKEDDDRIDELQKENAELKNPTRSSP